MKVSNRDHTYKRIINVCTYIFIQTRRGSTSDSVGVESMASTLEADSLYNADTTGEKVIVNKSSRYNNVTFPTLVLCIYFKKIDILLLFRINVG